MCGIVGCFGSSYGSLDDSVIEKIGHRGPDDSGIYVDEGNSVALGHTRLSIIDVSNNAHQPMTDETGNFTLVYNGEIYNFDEIKGELEGKGYKFNTVSDTEVVLNSFIAWGPACLHRFRGMFSFCVYDRLKNELFLARDRFGIKPLVYTFAPSTGFLFSSELKPFLAGDFFPCILSTAAVNDYFRFGSVQQPLTILEGVYSLMPGHAMTVRSDFSYSIDQYYDLVSESANRHGPETYQEAISEVREELEHATRYHMVGDVPVGAFLSGGVDSTAVLALMSQYTDQPINTFCVGFRQAENVADEIEIATRTAKSLGARHSNIQIDDNYVANIFDGFIGSIDQPSIDGINTYIVSLETAKEMKVAVSGLGGDEVFGGYPHFAEIAKAARLKRGPATHLASYVNSLRPNRFTKNFSLRGLEAESGLQSLRTIAKPGRILNFSASGQQPAHSSSLTSIQRVSKAEIEGYMLNTLLRDSDALSMAHSLELRPVLLDHKLVELAFRLDDGFKVRDGFLKSVLVDSVKELVPEEVWKREKTGFEMPFARWMNGRLNSTFSGVAKTQKAKKLFRKDYLVPLQCRIERKTLKRADWMSLILLSWIEQNDVQVS